MPRFDAMPDRAPISQHLFHRRQVLSCLAAVFAGKPDLAVVYIRFNRFENLSLCIRSNPSSHAYAHNNVPHIAPTTIEQGLLDQGFHRMFQEQLRRAHVDQDLAYNSLASLCGGRSHQMTRENHRGIIGYLSGDASPVWDDAADAYAQAYELSQATPSPARAAGFPVRQRL